MYCRFYVARLSALVDTVFFKGRKVSNIHCTASYTLRIGEMHTRFQACGKIDINICAFSHF